MITQEQAEHIYSLAVASSLAACDAALEDYISGGNGEGEDYARAVAKVRTTRDNLKAALAAITEKP